MLLLLFCCWSINLALNISQSWVINRWKLVVVVVVIVVVVAVDFVLVVVVHIVVLVDIRNLPLKFGQNRVGNRWELVVVVVIVTTTRNPHQNLLEGGALQIWKDQGKCVTLTFIHTTFVHVTNWNKEVGGVTPKFKLGWFFLKNYIFVQR